MTLFMDLDLVRRIVEAAIMAAPQPLTINQIYGLFPEEEPAPAGSIEKAISELQQSCDDRGVELIEVASGFRFQVKTDVHSWVARLWTERQSKYTRATLETLALVAYRQPITRGEIEQIRGVTVNPNTIKALEEREWIRVVGHRDVPGKPALFGTTKTFLDYFGLKSLDALPPLAELKEIPELDPELPFDRAPAVANAVMSQDDAQLNAEDKPQLSDQDNQVDSDDIDDFDDQSDTHAQELSDEQDEPLNTNADEQTNDDEQASEHAEPEHKHE
jgi:segregation and condensation protein B